MWTIFRKHFWLLFVWGLIFGAVAVGISLFFPLQYSASSQVLIISRDRSGVDPYTQAKSAERIGSNLVEVIGTTDFYNKVLSAKSAEFNKAYWTKLDAREQRKAWQKNVEAEVVYNTSLLKITAYATTRDEAVHLVDAVAATLVAEGWQYVGGDLLLKQVDDPLASQYPVRPNIALNAVAGFAIGVFVAGAWLIRYRRHTIFGLR